MTTFLHITPEPIEEKGVSCSERAYHGRAGTSPCSKGAKWRLDGQPLCGIHAREKDQRIERDRAYRDRVNSERGREQWLDDHLPDEAVAMFEYAYSAGVYSSTVVRVDLAWLCGVLGIEGPPWLTEQER